MLRSECANEFAFRGQQGPKAGQDISQRCDGPMSAGDAPLDLIRFWSGVALATKLDCILAWRLDADRCDAPGDEVNELANDPAQLVSISQLVARSSRQWHPRLS